MTDYTTYNHYLDDRSLSKEILSKYEAQDFLKHFCATEYNGNVDFATFVLDYATKQYLHFENGWLEDFGITKKELMSHGIVGVVTEFWHPEDFKVFNHHIFPELLRFISNRSRTEYSDYIFSYNFRLINRKHEVRTWLQRFSYLPAKDNQGPAGSAGIGIDITHFKNDDSVIYTIEKKQPGPAGVNYELIQKKVFNIDNGNMLPLTPQERKIIQLAGAGFSSQQIAAQLSISILTVNNHRKNILSKTGCKTIMEVINQLVKQGCL